MITKIIQSLWYKVSSATLALATAVHCGQVHTSFFGIPWTRRCQALEYKTTSYETGPLIEPQILAPRPPDSVSHRWAQGYLPFYKRSGWLWYAWSTPHSQKTVLDSIQLSMFCISRKQSSLLFGWSSQHGPPSAWAANCGHSAATWCPESQICSIWVQTERTPQHDKWPRCMRPREKQAFRWGEMSMCDVLSYTYTHTCAQEWDASLTWVHFKHGVLMMEDTGEQWRQLRMARALISGHQAPATSWGESRLSISVSHTFRKVGLWETILENRLGKEAAIPLHLSSHLQSQPERQSWPIVPSLASSQENLEEFPPLSALRKEETQRNTKESMSVQWERENDVNWAINAEFVETLAIFFHHRHLQATAVVPDSHPVFKASC